MGKEFPDRRPAQLADDGRIVEQRGVGGLYHQYLRMRA